MLFSLPDEILVELATVDLDVWCKLVETVPFFGKEWLLNPEMLRWVWRVGFPVTTDIIHIDNDKRFLAVKLGGHLISQVLLLKPETTYEFRNLNPFDYEKSCIVTRTPVQWGVDSAAMTVIKIHDVCGQFHCATEPAYVLKLDNDNFAQRRSYYIHGRHVGQRMRAGPN
jgi:hypothetical protein